MVPMDDDVLLQRLGRLMAAAKSINTADRRLILSLQADLGALNKLLQRRRDDIAQEMNAAGARNRAVTAYSHAYRSAPVRPGSPTISR